MNPFRLRVLCCIVLAFLFSVATQNVRADVIETGIFPRIVINDNIGAAGSRAYASPFDSVVSLNFNGGGSFCTGTLIAPNVVLTARHCNVIGGDDIVFGTDLNNSTFTGNVASVFNPAGGGSLLDGGDLSIVTLSFNIPTNIATPMRLIDETTSLIGQEAALVGYGWNGEGSSGHDGTADDFRWGGTNIIDRYGVPASASGSNIFSTDFDNGSPGNNTISGSDPNPLQFEATTAPGDSGGPLMVSINNEWLVAGVLSGGSTGDSTYGDISWWTGVAPFRSEIEAAGGVFYSAIPEPGSVSFLLFTVTVFVATKRKRKVV